MDFFCFVCAQTYKSIEQLFFHLKSIHSLLPNSLYKCGNKNCSQEFTSFRCFSKHMRKYNRTNEVEITYDTVETTNDTVETTNEDTVENMLELQANNTETSSPFDNFNSVNMNNNENNERKKELLKKNLEDLKKKILLIICKYYSKPTFARKNATEIQSDIKILTCGIANQLEILKSLNAIVPSLKDDFDVLLDFCTDPFKEMNTEYQFRKMLRNNNLFEHPQTIFLDNTIGNVVCSHHNILGPQIDKGTVLPIKFLIKRFFETPGMIDCHLNNIENINTSPKIKNFINGKIWLNKVKDNPNKILIPFFLYFDDFEGNNPLGAHKDPITMAYITFPTTPDHLKSKLEQILVAAVIRADDVKFHGNRCCFQKLVDDINDIQNNGIEFECETGTRKIFFLLGLVEGDNLGVNAVLGFTKSFSSNVFCRLCLYDKSAMGSLHKENELILRTRENYEASFDDNDVAKHGIRERSVFNDIYGFHVTENLYVDPMHDLFEGILHYDLGHILSYFIYTKKYFDLETLNLRKTGFDYQELEIGNVSGEISSNHLKNSSFNMSAREMYTFVHHLPLIIQDLVPEADSVWEFFVKLVQLIDLICSSEFDENDVENLETLISYHNSKYEEFFNDSLKPKHHMLIHYPRIIRYSGPLKHLWTFRQESKHQIMKKYLRSITSRKNVSYSLSIKYLYMFAYQCLSYNTEIWEPTSNSILLSKCSNFDSIKSLFSTNILNNNDVCFNSIKYCGTTYKKNMYFALKNSDCIQIFKIVEIFLNTQEIYVMGNECTINYNKNLIAYEFSNVNNVCMIKNIKDIKYSPMHLHNLPSGKSAFRVKSF